MSQQHRHAPSVAQASPPPAPVAAAPSPGMGNAAQAQAMGPAPADDTPTLDALAAQSRAQAPAPPPSAPAAPPDAPMGNPLAAPVTQRTVSEVPVRNAGTGDAAGGNRVAGLHATYADPSDADFRRQSRAGRPVAPTVAPGASGEDRAIAAGEHRDAVDAHQRDVAGEAWRRSHEGVRQGSETALTVGDRTHIARDVTTTRGGALGSTVTQDHARLTESADVRGMAGELRGVLQTRREALMQRATAPIPVEDPVAHQARIDDHERVMAEIHRIDNDILSLQIATNDADGRATVERIAQRHQVGVPERTRQVGTQTTTTTQTGLMGTSVGHAQQTRDQVTDENGSTHVRTTDSRTAVGRNGLEITRGHGSEDTTQHPDGTTTGRSESQSRTTTVGRVNGGYGVGHQDSRTEGQTRADGTRTEDQRTRGGSISYANGGVTGHGEYGRTHTERDADGEETRRRSVTASGDAGYVNGADGRGVRVAGNVGLDNRTREGAHNVNVGGEAQVTDHGSRFGVNGGGGLSSGLGRSTGTFAGGRTYTMNVTPVDGSNPPEYDLTLSLAYSGSIGGGHGNGGDELSPSDANEVRPSRGSGSVSAGMELRGSRTTTFTHRMSGQEAERYMASLRTASRGAGAPLPLPEFQIMQQAQQGMSQEQVLEDPAAARGMAVGSSLEYTTSAGATLRAGGEAGFDGASAGVNASASRDQTRTVRVGGVEVEGQRRVEITVTFNDARSQSAGANASLEGVGGSINRTNEQSGGRSVRIRLDPTSPSYDADFREVMAVRDEAAADALAVRHNLQITRRSETADTTSGGVGQMNDGQVASGLTRAVEHRNGQAVTVGEADAQGHRELSGSTDGRTTDTLTLRGGGHDIATDVNQMRAHNEVDAHGNQSIDADHIQQTSAPILPALLRNALQTDQTNLQRWHLNGHDVDVLVQRAASADGWDMALSGAGRLHIRRDWQTLRTRLVAPNPDAEWVAADPSRSVADRLARGRAITTFLGSVDPTLGDQTLGNALRGEGGERLGQHLEFPDSIHGRAAQYDALKTSVDGAAERWAGWRGPDHDQRVQRDLADIHRQLADMLVAVQEAQANNSFSSVGAAVETTAAITDLSTRIDDIAQEALHPPTPAAPPAAAAEAAPEAGHPSTPPSRPQGHAPAPPAPAAAQASAPAAGQRPSAAPAQVPAPAPQPDPALQMARRRQELNHLILELQADKRMERTKFELASSRIGNYHAHWYAGIGNLEEARDALDSLDELFPRWAEKLRDAYRLAGELGVGTGEIDPFRPNTNWRIDLLHQIRRSNDDMWLDVPTREARWRGQSAL